MATYVAAAGALLAMYGQYESGQQNARNLRGQAEWAELGARYTDYITNMQYNNALWQAQFEAGIMGQRAKMAGFEAYLTMGQAEAMEGQAEWQRSIAEKDIAFNESKAFDTLAQNLSTKKAQMGKSGVEVGSGSSKSFLADYWEKKSTEITTGADILREAADLEKAKSMFGAKVTRSRGTIQLAEASLLESQVPYILAMGDYSANMIKRQGEYNSALQRGQAAIWRAGGNQAITAGWLNAAGTGTTAAYNLLK